MILNITLCCGKIICSTPWGRKQLFLNNIRSRTKLKRRTRMKRQAMKRTGRTTENWQVAWNKWNACVATRRRDPKHEISGVRQSVRSGSQAAVRRLPLRPSSRPVRPVRFIASFSSASSASFDFECCSKIIASDPREWSRLFYHNKGWNRLFYVNKGW